MGGGWGYNRKEFSVTRLMGLRPGGLTAHNSCDWPFQLVSREPLMTYIVLISCERLWLICLQQNASSGKGPGNEDAAE